MIAWTKKLISAVASAAFAAAVLTAAVAAAGPATAATANSADAAVIVAQVQAHGYRVVVGELGDAPLTQCRVRSIRPARAITESAPIVRRQDGAVGRLSTVAYVDVDC